MKHIISIDPPQRFAETGRAEDCEGPSYWAATGQPVVEIYAVDGSLLSSNRPKRPKRGGGIFDMVIE